MGGGAPVEDMPKEINISSVSQVRHEVGGGQELTICSGRTQELSQIVALVFVIKAVTRVCTAPSAQSNQTYTVSNTHKKQRQLTVTSSAQKCERVSV